jgi:IclR family acetate operon transcriptional repressor
VEKAIAMLDVLALAPGGLELNEVAEKVAMSPPGAYRTIQTLLAGGLVTQDGKRGVYRLGPKLLVLARSLRSEAALAAAADQELRALAESTGESVALAVVRAGRIWSIAGYAGSGDLVAQPRLASGEPYFHSTGRGKLHLAYLPRAEAEALIAQTGLPKVGPHTITDAKRLWREVDQARARGYAVNRAERSTHLAGVAVPIVEGSGALLATIGISVPVFTLTESRERELAQAAQAAARRIEARLGGGRAR